LHRRPNGVTETPGTEQAAPEKPAEPLKFLADKGLGLLGLLAAAAYALSRPLYDAFYAPLGLRPEDLGLSQVEMISRGASSVLVIVLLFAVPIMLGVVLYHFLRMRPLTLQAAVLVSLAALSSLLLNGEPEVTVSRTAGVFIGLSRISLSSFFSYLTVPAAGAIVKYSFPAHRGWFLGY
jgi:hypothetical protein